MLFACLLPIFWTLWAVCWRAKTRGLKLVALAVFAVFILANAYCLFITYSRGGSVAAAMGLAYLFARATWNRRLSKRSQIVDLPRFYCTLALLAGLAVLFWRVGLGARSLESASDMSIENRITLWRYALQMAIDNPAGFGTGKSGEVYMQWYQPLEMTAGYRTMVNSYLTFLVEQGWLPFAFLLLGLCLFWFWASPGKTAGWSSEVATGLRATVLTFLVAGVFSTVMEEAILWIIPLLCAGILFLCTLFERTPVSRHVLVAGGSTVAAVCLVLFMTGLSHSDRLIRQFYRAKNGESIVAIRPWENNTTEWLMAPDIKVLGRSFGKLLRRLCLETGMLLRIGPFSTKAGDNVILVGNSVEGGLQETPAKLVLLAPNSLTEVEAQKLLAGHVLLLLPEIDEDGRVTFWRDVVRTSEPDKIKVVQLDGVGLQADWAWNQVVTSIKGL